MQLRITMDKDGSQASLRIHDIDEAIPGGQTAEARIRSFLQQHSQQIDPTKNPLDFIAVQIVEDNGLSWEWKGWGHETVMRWGHKLGEMGPATSGRFPGHSTE